uniref:Uncharacterized protein n=1 Tax=Helianthus annuus TaxID=4232 RepID=A0A251SVR6_HELAN
MKRLNFPFEKCGLSGFNFKANRKVINSDSYKVINVDEKPNVGSFEGEQNV